MSNRKLKALLQTENEQLQKLNEIVVRAIDEEKLLSEKLIGFEERELSFGNRLSDKISSFGGSWKFILIFIFLMFAWIAANAYLLSKPIDPFPFILLNLILSTLAAIQAPIIMMSQNRKEEKDRQRAISDYMINLKSEIEIRNMHSKIDLLITEQMKTLFEIQKDQLTILASIQSHVAHAGKDAEKVKT